MNSGCAKTRGVNSNGGTCNCWAGAGFFFFMQSRGENKFACENVKCSSWRSASLTPGHRPRLETFDPGFNCYPKLWLLNSGASVAQSCWSSSAFPQVWPLRPDPTVTAPQRLWPQPLPPPAVTTAWAALRPSTSSPGWPAGPVWITWNQEAWRDSWALRPRLPEDGRRSKQRTPPAPCWWCHIQSWPTKAPSRSPPKKEKPTGWARNENPSTVLPL